ncbi:nucleotidyl transferase AbiEii/AbiGii toxin family protein [Candidatus Pacearchaeota archaeon]|nr:nucleotidyl transferase AbiEii/AbiGii toxin family protein [Candidatus Pacearchaeota archaeon]
MIPLILRLKKASHKEIAKAQDIIVSAVYEVLFDSVLHGGTCIWRCYRGNRFSEDVDMYIAKDKARVNLLFELFEKKGFEVERKKISENSIYSKLNYNGTQVRFEAIFKKSRGSLAEYESAEGNLLTVYALTAEELIIEKVSTYLKRRKIRDLYDIFFLLRHVKDVSKVKTFLNELLSRFEKPLDEKDLRVIILEGVVPTTEQMLDYIKRRIEHG